MPVFGVKGRKDQSSVWESFPRYSVFIKIAIVKDLIERFAEVAYGRFLPHGVEIEFIFALQVNLGIKDNYFSP